MIGAGGALLATGNKSLAVALTLGGLALCLKEGIRPATRAIEQRPQKSHQKLGGKDQPANDGGAKHQDESRAGTTNASLLDTLEPGGVGKPGLRAIRRVGSRNNHGEEELDQGAASTTSLAGGKGKGKSLTLFADSTGLMAQFSFGEGRETSCTARTGEQATRA